MENTVNRLKTALDNARNTADKAGLVGDVWTQITLPYEVYEELYQAALAVVKGGL